MSLALAKRPSYLGSAQSLVSRRLEFMGRIGTSVPAVFIVDEEAPATASAVAAVSAVSLVEEATSAVLEVAAVSAVLLVEEPTSAVLDVEAVPPVSIVAVAPVSAVSPVEEATSATVDVAAVTAVPIVDKEAPSAASNVAALFPTNEPAISGTASGAAVEAFEASFGLP